MREKSNLKNICNLDPVFHRRDDMKENIEEEEDELQIKPVGCSGLLGF